MVNSVSYYVMCRTETVKVTYIPICTYTYIYIEITTRKDHFKATVLKRYCNDNLELALNSDSKSHQMNSRGSIICRLTMTYWKCAIFFYFK